MVRRVELAAIAHQAAHGVPGVEQRGRQTPTDVSRCSGEGNGHGDYEYSDAE